MPPSQNTAQARQSRPAEPLPDAGKIALSQSIRKGAIWSVLSTLLLRIASIGIAAITARILSPHDFGVFAVASTAYAIVSAIGEFGVSSCLIRADLSIDSLAPSMVTVSMVSSIIFASAMVFFARQIGELLGSADAAGSIRIMAIAVLMVGLLAVPGAQLTRDFKQHKLFLANAISFVPSNAALIVLAKLGNGPDAFAWSRIIGQAIVGCFLIVYTERTYRPGLARYAISVLCRFGLPLATANFVNFVLLNVDYALIGRMLGVVFLGIYVVAFNVASWSSSLLGAVINNVAMPAFSRVSGHPAQLQYSLSRALRVAALVVMPIGGMQVVLARPLVLVLYGGKWAPSAAVLSILAVYAAASILCVLFANMLAALGRSRSLLLVQLIWLGALAPAMLLGVHADGIFGAAVAHVIVIFPIVLPCYLYVLAKTTGIRLTTIFLDLLPSLLSACAAALAAWMVLSQVGNTFVQLILGASVGGTVYVLLMAPHAVSFVRESPVASPGWQRVFRTYDLAARTVGLQAFNPPRHARAGRYSAPAAEQDG